MSRNPDDNPATVAATAAKYRVPATQNNAARCATILETVGWPQRHRPTMGGGWRVVSRRTGRDQGHTTIDLNFGPGGELDALHIGGKRVESLTGDITLDVIDHVNGYPTQEDE
jgi:hypothetical protein